MYKVIRSVRDTRPSLNINIHPRDDVVRTRADNVVPRRIAQKYYNRPDYRRDARDSLTRTVRVK